MGLLLVALISHLGYLPVDTSSDEPRRALVALEMIYSNDYLTPTINGERYFNKPPLYNWLIVGSYWLFGNYSSFALRFPMLVSLLLLGLTTFVFVRQYAPVSAGRRTMIAWVVTLMVLTNGRVLFYDSLWSSIDIPFAWLTYLAMMLIYHFDRRGQYALLFLTSYALTALGFLTKGLPAVVFQGLTLLSWFACRRQLWRLVQPAHIAGILLLLGIIGSYYAAYLSRNHIPFGQIASVLFDESTKRTVVEFGVGQTLLHLLTFPFEMIFHFAPYLLLLVLLTRRGALATLGNDSFIAFNALVFSVNILVYWSSPQVYARYLIGLLPLLFTVLAYLYYEKNQPTDSLRRGIDYAWLGMALIVTVGCWVTLFVPQTRTIPGVVWKTALTSVLLAAGSWWLWHSPGNRLMPMVLVMVAVRIGMNMLTLPGRLPSRQFYKNESDRIARKTLGAPLYGFRETIGSTGATDVNSFYIAVVRGNILRRTDQKRAGAYYIADSLSLIGQQYERIDTLRLFDRHRALLVRFTP